MKAIKNICVFCGSSTTVAQKYLDVGSATGALLAKNNFTTVYGGGRIGLMGALADATLNENGKVIGIIPKFLRDKEVAHAGLTELHLTETMHERQVGMAVLADAFLILPGGMGTVAEFFEVLTFKQLQLHDKPIALLNSFGYWDSLLAFTKHGEAEKFLRAGDEKLFTRLENIDALGGYLSQLKS
jgi:hypothetical protein